jgi:hypothetical protein
MTALRSTGFGDDCGSNTNPCPSELEVNTIILGIPAIVLSIIVLWRGLSKRFIVG